MALQRSVAPFPDRAPGDPVALAQAVREILRARKLTLYRAAALSQSRHPHERAYHIRANFCFQLRAGLSPTVHQVLALSELTGYRLWDWLALFGFSLSDIPRLQAVLARPRTGALDNELIDPEGSCPASNNLFCRSPNESGFLGTVVHTLPTP